MLELLIENREAIFKAFIETNIMMLEVTVVLSLLISIPMYIIIFLK